MHRIPAASVPFRRLRGIGLPVLVTAPMMYTPDVSGTLPEEKPEILKCPLNPASWLCNFSVNACRQQSCACSVFLIIVGASFLRLVRESHPPRQSRQVFQHRLVCVWVRWCERRNLNLRASSFRFLCVWVGWCAHTKSLKDREPG